MINIASVHGLVASPNKVGYVSAKHGLIGPTRTAALEGGAQGIAVNAICPAYVRTLLVDKQISDQAHTQGIRAEEVIEKIMLAPAAVKRLIEPEEVADFVAYLCSPAGAVFTGAALTMDLGWTARRPFGHCADWPDSEAGPETAFFHATELPGIRAKNGSHLWRIILANRATLDCGRRLVNGPFLRCSGVARGRARDTRP